MHELSLTRAIVDTCTEEARGERVSRVVVEVGRLSGVVPDALRFCYDACARGTSLEGSTLEIIEADGRGACRRCGREFSLVDALEACPCGSFDFAVVGGRELRVKAMEVF